MLKNPVLEYYNHNLKQYNQIIYNMNLNVVHCRKAASLIIECKLPDYVFNYMGKPIEEFNINDASYDELLDLAHSVSSCTEFKTCSDETLFYIFVKRLIMMIKIAKLLENISYDVIKNDMEQLILRHSDGLIKKVNSSMQYWLDNPNIFNYLTVDFNRSKGISTIDIFRFYSLDESINNIYWRLENQRIIDLFENYKKEIDEKLQKLSVESYSE